MADPGEVIDMHTHLFNSKYLPLKGIIADAITGSSFSESKRLVSKSKILATDSEGYYAESIWKVVEEQLGSRVRSLTRGSKTLRTLESDQDEYSR